MKNYGLYSDLMKQDQPSTLKRLCVNSFKNLKIDYLQMIKTISFMKLAIVSVKQSTSVSLNGFKIGFR